MMSLIGRRIQRFHIGGGEGAFEDIDLVNFSIGAVSTKVILAICRSAG